MKAVINSICFVVIFLVAFHLAAFTGAPHPVMIYMIIIAPLPILYMISMIIKSGESAQSPFDENHFEEHTFKQQQFKVKHSG